MKKRTAGSGAAGRGGMGESPEGLRLNKFLAQGGVGSRRFCDRAIQEGAVTVNGEPCLEPATRVGSRDAVKFRGRLIAPLQAHTIALNKPRGYLCTRSDEKGRATVYDLLPSRLHHLSHVGRLDRDSEGLLILTSDGVLAQELSHPSGKHPKIYVVTLDRSFDNELLESFLSGVHTPQGKAKALAVRRLSARRLEVTLTTGLKRQIREMASSLGHRVTRLRRVQIGALELGALAEGKWAPINEAQCQLLLAKRA